MGSLNDHHHLCILAGLFEGEPDGIEWLGGPGIAQFTGLLGFGILIAGFIHLVRR